MALDDLGNERIDFAWGNIPLQPNHDYDEDLDLRLNIALYPGDGMAEAILLHNDGYAPSNMLDGVGNHAIALRQWSGYPAVAQDGVTGPTLTVNWWTEGQPASEFPDIVGSTLESAVKQLKEVGVPNEFLVDLLSDNSENPYLQGENVTQPGLIVWHYIEPETVIGTHWDGTPWLAKEAEGLVEYAYSYPAEQFSIIPFDNDGQDMPAMWWAAFSVIQTTDPNKNSWEWWN
jgi:hypothetical protein